MGSRGFYGFRYKKKYYMIYNPYDSNFMGLGIKLLKEIREMIKNNKFEEWLHLFTNLEIIDKYIVDKKRIEDSSFINVLHSGYICIERECFDKINYRFVDGEFFYILDFDKKRFIVKELGYRRQKYNLFNGEIDKVYFENSSGEESSECDM
jgi:hypothetical protein